ncbi:MAG: hypothetical protein HC803_07580 [Saprospiraceae bacterium]|nr:hypothetical protein [Saprospiraceae bacterium]
MSRFVIQCFEKNNKYWQNIGNYTPDFLMLSRNENNEINKALIIETKGKGFANDPVFKAKKHFVETEFLKRNNEAFNYNRFDFLYLEDDKDINKHLETLEQKINTFFK